MTPEELAHKKTDDELATLERRISKVYAQANKDIESKLNSYMSQFKQLDEDKKALVEVGKLTQKEYEQWRLNKIAVGELWEAKRNNLAQDYLNADKIAYSLANDELPNIYALNHNYTAYALESQTNMNLQFTLYDRGSVERLLKDNVNLLPLKVIDKKLEKKVVRWNEQKVQSVVTQGLLQGESIPKIANRLQQVTEMNKNSAIRNARTAVTGAENAGRQDTYNEATAKGIELRKQWISAIDKRTRDIHAEADGQIVDSNKHFIVGNERLMFPGDVNSGASGSNLYNCRCTVIAVIEDLKKVDPVYRRDNISGELIKDMTYSQWEKSK